MKQEVIHRYRARSGNDASSAFTIARSRVSVLGALAHSVFDVDGTDQTITAAEIEFSEALRKVVLPPHQMHAAILSAIQSGNSSAAERAMESHLLEPVPFLASKATIIHTRTLTA